MFVCNECVKTEGQFYFMLSMISYGKCEMCNKIGPCADIHDYDLIKEKKKKE